MTTLFTTDPGASWDVWVGPASEPGTGRRLGAVRWRNHFRAEGLPGADARWLDWLTATAEGRVLLCLIQRDLSGRVLGCSRGSHGLILARLADGRSPEEIRTELAEFRLATRDLFRVDGRA